MKNDWQYLLRDEQNQPYYIQLKEHLLSEYQEHVIFPKEEDVFNALHLTSYASTKIVILGQDPYHGEGQAHGLSFSVNHGVAIPPSLKNMYKELQSDIGFQPPQHGCLEQWAEQGVLLLNSILTVRAGEPFSHKGLGWERFTDHIIQLLNKREQPIVFLLWGKHAHAKKLLITNHQHLVLEAPHPSPLSAHRGFFGSKPFSRANQFLAEKGFDQVDWNLKV